MRNIAAVPPPVWMPEKKNVVVIGGGVTGTMTAWELARAGHNVTLLEARHLGNGSSSRSAACIRQQFTTETTVRGMRYSTLFYADWKKIIGGSQSPITQNGYLFLYDVTADPNALQQQIAMQQEAGLAEVTFLTPAAIQSLFPYIDITGLNGATWCPTDGFLQPDLVYKEAAQAAQALGARIITNAEVVNATLESSGRSLVSVTTADGREFAGDVFVNAASNWAPRISALCEGHALQIIVERRYLYFLPGMGDKDECGLNADNIHAMPMTITPRGAYCRPEARTQLMTGWAHYTANEIPTFEGQDTIEPGFSAASDEGLGAAIRKELALYIPAIHEMGRLTHVTSGYYDTTPDHNPFIDRDPFRRNLIHAAGFSGHGVMHAPFTARIVAELVAEQEDDHLQRIELPFELGLAELSTFALKRTFQREGLVL